MTDDLRVRSRHISPFKNAFQLVKIIRGFRQDPQRANFSDNAQTRLTGGPGRDTRKAKGPTLTESIYLFPGWAVRRYVDDDRNEFDLHVHVSGYATRLRSPPTRAQMAFMSLAKRMASLSKFAETYDLKSTPEPDSPESKEHDSSLDELDESYSRLNVDGNDSSSDDDVFQPQNEPTTLRADVSDLLQRLQRNLDSRVQLFLPSMLSSRVVRLELFASQHLTSVGRSDVNTGPDGTFHHHFVIKWDDICQLSLAHYLRGEHITEREFILHATLLPTTSNAEESKVEKQKIILTHAPTRVISDIDDTIKMSNILGGPRTTFRNVFARDLKEAVIPGMGEWYNSMWNQGVRFHYVSNGPNQLLPLVLEFLQVARLPHGSIKLKSYAARSLFKELLKPPADRKRDGLVQILNSFKDSKFILVGDSGEQDLELYTQLAGLHPTQILGVFIRDVEPDATPIQDPTGQEWDRHPLSRNNTSSSLGNSVAPNVSRSNSVFDKLTSGRGKFWLGNTPSPAFSPAPLTPLPPDGDDDLPTSPTIFEYDELTDDLLSDAQPIKNSAKESAWLSSSPVQLSSSPSSVSPLDQAEDVVPRRSSFVARTRLNSRSRSNGTEASFSDVAEADGDPITFSKRRSPIVSITDGVPLSQSPERASFLKTNMSARPCTSPKPGSPIRRKSCAADEIHTPPPSSRSSLRPRTPRRTTTTPSSISGAGADTPTRSSSLLSLARPRYTSEAEKKRAELQNRVWRARAEIPPCIVLRIFRDPSECMEVEELLKNKDVVK